MLAWNPMDVEKVIPPFCHYGFQVTVLNNKLNLMWNQRSIDTALGLPFNIASYGLLLHLLAKESGFKALRKRNRIYYKREGCCRISERTGRKIH